MSQLSEAAYFYLDFYHLVLFGTEQALNHLLG